MFPLSADLCLDRGREGLRNRGGGGEKKKQSEVVKERRGKKRGNRE